MATETMGGRSTTPASTEEVLKGLNDLLQLDHDAIGAYEIAIEKLEDRDHADQIAGFKRDHQNHIRDLNELIATLGGTPTNEPHATGPFKQAMQSLGALGGDKGTLIAWRTNELQVRTKYDSYASKAMLWPNAAKRLVDKNALDEERHYQWVTDVLKSMGVPTAEGAEQDVATRMREGAQKLSGVASRAGAAAEGARMRTADGLESAAERLDELGDKQSGQGGARAKVGGAAHRVADGIEATAGFIRDPDAQRARSNLEDQVRTSPVQSLLMTFGVGFVIGRLLR